MGGRRRREWPSTAGATIRHANKCIISILLLFQLGGLQVAALLATAHVANVEVGHLLGQKRTLSIILVF